MKYIITDNFNNIEISENNLVLCDIDETLLYNKIYYITPKTTITTNTTPKKINLPIYTDKKGFDIFLEKIKKTNSKLYFITSRTEDLLEFTNKQFKLMNLDSNLYPVIYCGNIDKTIRVKENIDTSIYNKIVFIDDIKYNLYTMHCEFGDKIATYLYRRL